MRFLTKNTGKGEETDATSSVGDSEANEVEHLTGGKPLWDPALNRLLILGGFSISASKKLRFPLHLWVRLVSAFRYVCLGVCISRLCFATRPAFTDYWSCATTIVLHFHLLFAPVQLRKVFKARRCASR